MKYLYNHQQQATTADISVATIIKYQQTCIPRRFKIPEAKQQNGTCLLRERDSTQANTDNKLSTTTEINVLAQSADACRVIDWHIGMAWHASLCKAESPARTTTARADWPAFAPLSLDVPHYEDDPK
jgi:hypothetical protein